MIGLDVQTIGDFGTSLGRAVMTTTASPPAAAGYKPNHVLHPIRGQSYRDLVVIGPPRPPSILIQPAPTTSEPLQDEQLSQSRKHTT
jgi:hypothetical protein